LSDGSSASNSASKSCSATARDGLIDERRDFFLSDGESGSLAQVLG
jgi:hypothetical protein